MPDLIYTIKTPAELEGAKAAEQALERNIGKAEVLGRSTDALREKLARVKASIEAYTTAQTAAAAAQTAASAPQEKAIDESERYQQKLQEMAAAQEAAALASKELADAAAYEQLKREALANSAAKAAEAEKQTAAAKESHIRTTELLAAANDSETDSTDRAFTSKKQLKDAIKQLGHEFPILGSLGRLALNPITAIVAGITGAFALWNAKIKEVETTYASMELPDLSPPDPAKINASTEAWKNYGAAVAKIAEDMNGIEQQTARTLAAISATAAMLAKMRQDEAKKNTTGQAAGGPGADAFFEREAARATFETESKAAQDLLKRAKEAEAKAKAERINSPEADARNLADMKAQAEAAEKSKAIEMARLKDIADATNPDANNWGAKFRVIWRQFANGTDTQGLADIANQNIDSADAVIGRYNRALKDKPARDARRSARDENYSQSSADIEAANKMQEEAERKWREANVRYAYEMRQQGLPTPVTPTGAGGSITPDAAAEIKRLNDLNRQLLESYRSFFEAWQREIDNMGGRAKDGMNP